MWPLAAILHQTEEGYIVWWLNSRFIDCMHVDCAGGYNEEFRGKMRSVLYNLKDEKNQDFRGKVLRGEVTPTRICHMESHDMASEVLLCLSFHSSHAANQPPSQETPMTQPSDICCVTSLAAGTRSRQAPLTRCNEVTESHGST